MLICWCWVSKIYFYIFYLVIAKTMWIMSSFLDIQLQKSVALEIFTGSVKKYSFSQEKFVNLATSLCIFFYSYFLLLLLLFSWAGRFCWHYILVFTHLQAAQFCVFSPQSRKLFSKQITLLICYLLYTWFWYFVLINR